MAASGTVLLYRIQYYDSRQNIIIMFWKYLIDIRSEAWLILFWEYINANLFALWNVRSGMSIMMMCSHIIRHVWYVRPWRVYDTNQSAVSQAKHRTVKSGWSTLVLYVTSSPMQSGAWNVEIGKSTTFGKPGRVVGRVSDTRYVEPGIQNVDPGVLLKVFIVRPLEFGCVTWLIWSGIINWRPGKFSFFNFNYTISREEHKTIYRSLRITGMAFSNQSELRAFCIPGQVNLKISYHILPNPQFRKMTCRDWPNPRRWLTESGQIPEENLPRMANPIIWLTELGHIPT
jgi:hypothetical protein